jgi:DcaP outer membrane protein
MGRRALWRVAVVLAWTTLGGSAPAFADEADELRALKDEIAAERAALAKEREELKEQRLRVDDALTRIEDNEAERSIAATIEGAPAVGAEGDAAVGPRIDVYGFAMLDAIYDFNRVDPNWKSSLRPSKIPVNCPGDAGCLNDGETILSVKQSRLGFKGYFPTEYGVMKTIFEFELYGTGVDEGQTTFRLRHAWGELGQIGAGQTWSLFMDPDVFPNTVEYWGPPGMVFFRNAQVRWSPDIPWISDERWTFKTAIEAPGSSSDSGKVPEFNPDFALSSWDSYPDWTTQVRFTDEWGHAQLSTIVRGLGVEANLPDGREYRARELGWGFNLASVLNLGWLLPALENDQLLFQVAYGYGIANYMNDGGSDIGPDSDPPGAQAKTIPTLGWLLYYNRTWNERWTSSIGYSEHRQWTLSGQTDDAFEVGQYANVNVLYHPTPDMLVGPELIWGRRENRNGDSGNDTRIQVSFKYNFAGTIWGGQK